MADIGIIRSVSGGGFSFEFEVTIEEQHTDEVTITAHPVERGAPVTDHFYRNAAQLTVKVGSSAAFIGSTDLSNFYTDLIAMQRSGGLIAVQTGKRYYDSMLIHSIEVDTVAASENAMMLTMQLQEVILVDTLATTMPPAGNRANPMASAGVSNTGTQTLRATN